MKNFISYYSNFHGWRVHLATLYCFQQKKLDAALSIGSLKTEDELTCTVCLEQVNVGEIVRSLPCLHQVCSLTQIKFQFFGFYYLKFSSTEFNAPYCSTSKCMAAFCDYLNLKLFCSSMQIASTHGCGNRERAQFANSEQDPVGKKADKLKWMLHTWFS